MEDSRLVYILEEDLGCPNIAAISRYGDLITNNSYKNKNLIVSYEVRKDFWHTVHVSLNARERNSKRGVQSFRRVEHQR